MLHQDRKHLWGKEDSDSVQTTFLSRLKELMKHTQLGYTQKWKRACRRTKITQLRQSKHCLVSKKEKTSKYKQK